MPLTRFDVKLLAFATAMRFFIGGQAVVIVAFASAIRILFLEGTFQASARL